ncbi:MAG: vWA domain-containing protein [Planctomycetota bacterium]
MSFTNPPVLLFLVLPAALAVWTWRRHDRRIALPFDHGLPIRGGRWRFLINLAETIPALLLAVALFLLAGPQQLSEPKTERILSNIQLCVDVSGSMTASFGDGTRYDASMSSINEFLDFRKGDAFGLTFFGNNFLHWVPLTSDVSAVRCAPPFMRPEVVPYWFGGTEIGKALRACKTELLRHDEGDRLIILVTDGFSADLMGGNDVAVAKELKENNIRVCAILVGGMSIPGEILTITNETGGIAFEAGDPEVLKGVFQQIDQLQKTKLKKSLAESMDHYLPYCIAGLALVGVLSLTQFGLRYTPW